MLTADEFGHLKAGDIIYIDPDFTQVETGYNNPGYNYRMEELADGVQPRKIREVNGSLRRVRLDCGWWWVKEWLSKEPVTPLVAPSFDEMF